MRNLLMLLMLLVVMVLCWGIVQAATPPTMIMYCEYNCPTDYMCSMYTTYCYCEDHPTRYVSCIDYACSGACNAK